MENSIQINVHKKSRKFFTSLTFNVNFLAIQFLFLFFYCIFKGKNEFGKFALFANVEQNTQKELKKR